MILEVKSELNEFSTFQALLLHKIEFVQCKADEINSFNWAIKRFEKYLNGLGMEAIITNITPTVCLAWLDFEIRRKSNLSEIIFMNILMMSLFECVTKITLMKENPFHSSYLEIEKYL
ncbi:hypothetical protein [Neobacillus terrae]|uniref:hypothetical protein n=1 Tax=Neobacillus terrae TaxID=3034837 RepID=UPI001408AFEE|nr:hypothetical protein [Neobacillus terrae]NHM32461.1 hypothetical protein [Neobacillus terrae]